MRQIVKFLSLLIAGSFAGMANALDPVDAEKLGFASPTGMGFLEPATIEALQITSTAYPLFILMAVICLFVLGLLIWLPIRYSEKANPVASNVTHSTILEILWTGIPTIIVVVIGIIGVRQIISFEETRPFGLVNMAGEVPAEETILVIDVNGMPAWNWQYELVYFGDEKFISENPDYFDAESGEGFLKQTEGQYAFNFVSTMLEHPERENRYDIAEADEAEALAVWQDLGRSEDFYQFDVDNRLVIPSGVQVVVNVGGPVDTDKQHAWAVPSFAAKRDFWPGRVNASHFTVFEGHEGLYFGQCSEFCGANHAYMPIAVHVVTLDEYRDYLASQMAAAVAAQDSGGVFTPEYLPVNLPAPYGDDSTIASR